MNREPTTPAEELDFYRQAENQTPQGTPRRRRPPLPGPVPMRFPQHMVEQVRARAETDKNPSGDEIESMALDFEQREFTTDELSKIKRTRR